MSWDDGGLLRVTTLLTLFGESTGRELDGRTGDEMISAAGWTRRPRGSCLSP